MHHANHNVAKPRFVCEQVLRVDFDELRPDPAGPHERLITFVADRPGHDFRYAVDAGKVQREFGGSRAAQLMEANEQLVLAALQAETLAQAKNLKAARDAFKPLSASLAKYLADNKAGMGTYHEAYCPMVKANWLQTGNAIKKHLGLALSDEEQELERQHTKGRHATTA